MGSANTTRWSRIRNRISAERHRESGVRAPKRYRKKVDDYFRRIAREAGQVRGATPEREEDK